MDITDLATDADLWKPNFRHINTHCIGNLAKLCTVIPFFISQAKDRNAIANTFIHQMVDAIAWWMWTVNIAGLVMGAFMAVNKSLKFRWRDDVIGPEDKRLATLIPYRHTCRNMGATFFALYKTDSLPFVICAGWRLDDIIGWGMG